MPDRTIRCLHCGAEVVLSARVVSTSCGHCYKRISVEDFVVKSEHSMSNINTCGSLSVTAKGQVWAPVNVHDVSVEGMINGNVRAQDKVTIETGGRLVGDVAARRLEVKPGATLKGFYRIDPEAGGSGEEPTDSQL